MKTCCCRHCTMHIENTENPFSNRASPKFRLTEWHKKPQIFARTLSASCWRQTSEAMRKCWCLCSLYFDVSVSDPHWRQCQWATLTRRENCETKQAAWSSHICTAGHFFHVNVPVDADVTSINNLFMAENDNILRCDDNVDDNVSKSEDKIADDQMTAEVAAGNKTALPTSQLIPTNFAYTRLPTLLFHTQHTLYPLSAQTQNPPFVQYPPSYSIGYTLDQKDPSLWSTNGHYLPIYAYMHMQ